MDGRRELPRWKVMKQVNVTFQDSDRLSGCVLEDINLKGMCLSLTEKLPQDRVVKIGLELSSEVNIEVYVQIPWIKKMVGHYTHGMAFNRIMDEDKDKLYQYINNHCSQQLKEQWWQNTR